MEIRIPKSKVFFSLVGILFVITSCDSNRVFDEYKTLNDNKWIQEKPVEFNMQIVDTISRNNLFINIRNNKDYQYSNLFLITHINFPDGKKIVDTLEYEMADKRGQFLGYGISDVKENKLFLKENIIFPTSGNYTVSIYQAMRKNGAVDGIKELEGITDVGFRIEKVERND